MNERNEAFLSVRELTVEYSSGGEVIHAVNNVSFNLRKGETIGLVGETGAGKTTIAKAILSILPKPQARISKGKIFFEGRDLLTLDREEIRKVRGKEIAMIFQDPMTALNPIMRIGDQIAEVIDLHERCGKTKAAKKAREMLEMVGIPGVRYHEYPHQFSGGMKQRVVIAMALACNPKLLLADEPTTALDVTIQAQVLDMINELKEKLRTSMVMITHDLGVVAEVCDSVAVIYAGEVMEYGSKEQVFDNPLYPYTKGLFASLPDLNTDVRRLNPIEGLPPNPADLPEGCAFHPRCPYASDECRREHIPLIDVGGGHLCRCCRLEAIAKEAESWKNR